MKTIKLLTVLTLLFGLISCNSDDDSNSNDNSSNNSLAKYSGIIVGSTGYYNLELKENNSTATIVFDGNTYNLSSTESLTSNQTIENFNLTDGTISLSISLESNGSNPSISFTIPGHDIVATIYRESSTNEDELYIGGSESHDSSGVLDYKTTLNIHIQGNTFDSFERITFSPQNPSDVGETFRYRGTVNRTGSTIVFSGSFESSPLTLNVVGNTLTSSESDSYGTFEVLLTRTN